MHIEVSKELGWFANLLWKRWMWNIARPGVIKEDFEDRNLLLHRLT